MPTGYTHRVQNGEITSLRDFALVCARAFGALMNMRDAPLDAPIPERFEPSDYHDKKLEDAQGRLTQLNSLTVEQWEGEAEKQYEKAIAGHKDFLKRTALELSRYETMLADVHKWQAPEGASNLKNFMIEQLESSIKFDCVADLIKEPKKLTGSQWFTRELEFIQRDIEYHIKNRLAEIESTEERNRWLAALRASFPEET